MILADTSVWVEHFRHGLPTLADGLHRGRIAIHSVVIGELATGNLASRGETLSWLGRLPRRPEPDAAGCLAFLERYQLFGNGIGWSDVQLLAAAHVSGMALWSLDKRLALAARRLGVQ